MYSKRSRDSSIVPELPLDEQQKLWTRIIRFVFSDVWLSMLNKQQLITSDEQNQLSESLRQRCSISPHSIFRSQD